MFIDDFLVAEVEEWERECQRGSNESESPERDVSDELVSEITNDECNGSVRCLFGKQKTLEFEDEKVGYIGDFAEKQVECVFIDLVVLTWFQATDGLENYVIKWVPDKSLSTDEFGSCLDGSRRGKTDP